MSQFSTGLDLPYISGTGASGGQVFNEALAFIDSVLGKGVEGISDDEPASPDNGQAWIVGTPTSGDLFETHDGEIALYVNDGWLFYDVQQGTRTFDRATNTALIKGTSTRWHYCVGSSIFFARITSDYTYSSGSWDSINNWTQMAEVGTDGLFEHNPTGSDDGRCEVKHAGLYHVVFGGSVTPLTSLSTFLIGIGHNGTTAEVPNIELVNCPVNVTVPFHCELVYAADEEDDFYVTCDRTVGTGSLRFEDDRCYWRMSMIRP